MKVHINSLNNILQQYISDTMIPKYVNSWKQEGLSLGKVGLRTFGIVAGSELFLKGQLNQFKAQLLMIADKDGYIDIDTIRNSLLKSIQYVKQLNMPITIPGIEWNVDEEDINGIYELSKSFAKET